MLNFTHGWFKQSLSADIQFALIVVKLRNLVSLRHEGESRCCAEHYRFVRINKSPADQVLLVTRSDARPPYLPHSLLCYWLNCKHLVSNGWQLHRHALLHALRTGHNLDLCCCYRTAQFCSELKRRGESHGVPAQLLAPGVGTCFERRIHCASLSPELQLPASLTF